MIPNRIRILTAVFILSLAVLTLVLHSLYSDAISLAKKQYNSHQSILAKQTALGIEGHLKRLARELELLAEAPAVRNLDIEQAALELKQEFAYVQSLNVNDIGLLDSEGIARLTLIAPQLTGKDFSFRAYFKQARERKTGQATYEFITFQGVDAGQKGVIIAMPIFPRPGEFGGVVLFSIKINELIKTFAPPHADDCDCMFWAIDRQNHVLYHPSYRDGLVLDELPDLTDSFTNFLEKIKEGRPYQAEYRSPKGIETIAAAYPLDVAGQTWSVVMATPSGEVSGQFTNLTGHFGQGILAVILAILGGSLSIIYLFNRWNHILQKQINERVQVEEELRISEKRFRALFNQASDSIMLMAFGENGEPVIVDANIATCETHGYSKDELLGKTIRFLDTTETAQHVAERAKRLKAGETLTFEGTHVRKDGTVFPIEVSSQTIKLGEKTYILAIDRDITERKRAEDLLRQSRQMLRLVLDNIPQCVFWKDRHSVYLGCNQNFAQAAGINDPQDIIGKTDYDLPWRKEQSDFFRECDRRVIETNTPEYHIIEKQLPADGKERWLDTSKIPLLDAESNVVGILGTYEDITERLLAEKELEKARDELELRVSERTTDLKSANELLQLEIKERERAEGVLRTIAKAVSGATGDAFFVSLVQSLAKTLGMDFAMVGRFVGDIQREVKTIAIYGHGEILENFRRPLDKSPCALVDSQKMCLYPENVRQTFPEDPLLEEMGIESYLGTKLCDSAGNAIGLMAVMDSSPIANPEMTTSMLQIFAVRAAAELERKRQEEELLKARNLESIGRLAAGIAHEINNPLTNASLQIELLESTLVAGASKDHRVLQRLKAVERNIDKASTIARELLLFSRQKEVGLVPLSINEIIGSALTLLTHNLNDIRIEQQLADIPDVLGDPLTLENLFINILDNAIEAMPEGGSISIATSCQNSWVVSTVSDTGVGIPEEYLAKVFDPFFTTKEVGEGTGLGLSICYGIVKQHNGMIELSSSEHEGTQVTIKFPALEV